METNKKYEVSYYINGIWVEDNFFDTEEELRDYVEVIEQKYLDEDCSQNLSYEFQIPADPWDERCEVNIKAKVWDAYYCEMRDARLKGVTWPK